MAYQKKDFKSVYLDDFKMISGIMDLTLQDVIGAMILMIRSGILTKARSSLWSKVQFDMLYKLMMNMDDGLNKGIMLFKKAVAKTRLDRIRKHSAKKNTQKKDYDEYDDVDISTEPIDRDKQMNQASDELLANDEIWFTDEYSDSDD